MDRGRNNVCPCITSSCTWGWQVVDIPLMFVGVQKALPTLSFITEFSKPWRQGQISISISLSLSLSLCKQRTYKLLGNKNIFNDT